MGALRSHRQFLDVQQNGALALANLTINSDENVRRGSANAMRALVEGMEAHPRDAELQELAAAALANLAPNAGIQARSACSRLTCSRLTWPAAACCLVYSRLLPDPLCWQERVGAAGCIRAVVAAMRGHTDAGGVQARGAQALAAFAGDAENALGVAQGGGCEAVVAAMWAHGGDADVQENCAAAVSALAAEGDNLERLAAAGAIELVVAALRSHVGNAAVCRDGCEALANLVRACLGVSESNRVAARPNSWSAEL